MNEWKNDGGGLPAYHEGDDLDYYLNRKVMWDIVIENAKEDLGGNATPEECVAEIRRLCETSVRHYIDCRCAICR